MKIGLRLHDVELLTIGKILEAVGRVESEENGPRPLGAFIDPKSANFVDECRAVVDLKIDSVSGEDITKLKWVTREEIDQLWDLLGIFPRAASSLEGRRLELFDRIVDIRTIVDMMQEATYIDDCEKILTMCKHMVEILDKTK